MQRLSLRRFIISSASAAAVFSNNIRFVSVPWCWYLGAVNERQGRISTPRLSVCFSFPCLSQRQRQAAVLCHLTSALSVLVSISVVIDFSVVSFAFQIQVVSVGQLDSVGVAALFRVFCRVRLVF